MLVYVITNHWFHICLKKIFHGDLDITGKSSNPWMQKRMAWICVSIHQSISTKKERLLNTPSGQPETEQNNSRKSGEGQAELWIKAEVRGEENGETGEVVQARKVLVTQAGARVRFPELGKKLCIVACTCCPGNRMAVMWGLWGTLVTQPSSNAQS